MRYFLNLIIIWEYRDVASPTHERPEYVLFDAAVNHGNMKIASTGADVERSLGRHLPYQIYLLRIGEGFVLFPDLH